MKYIKKSSEAEKRAYALGTFRAKKAGYNSFKVGSPGRIERNKVAESMLGKKPPQVKQPKEQGTQLKMDLKSITKQINKIDKSLASKSSLDLAESTSPEMFDKESLRQSIIAEYDAINLYEQLAEETKNSKIKQLLLSIAQEEKVHVGELEAKLNSIDSEHQTSVVEGHKEVADNIEKGYVRFPKGIIPKLKDDKLKLHPTTPQTSVNIPETDSQYADSEGIHTTRELPAQSDDSYLHSNIQNMQKATNEENINNVKPAYKPMSPESVRSLDEYNEKRYDFAIRHGRDNKPNESLDKAAENLIPTKVQAMREGRPYLTTVYKKPGEGTEVNFADQELSDNIKDIIERFNFISTNARHFNTLAPTQRENFVQSLNEADKMLQISGKKMENEVKEATTKNGKQMYTDLNPLNAINRSRKHLRETIKAVSENKPSSVVSFTNSFTNDFREALETYQNNAGKFIKKAGIINYHNTEDKVNCNNNKHLIEQDKNALKEKLLGNIEHFLEKYKEEEDNKIKKSMDSIEASRTDQNTIDKQIDYFLKGYEKLAYLGNDFDTEKLDELFFRGYEINRDKNLNLKLSNDSRLDKVIGIDSVAHKLHSEKNIDGTSQYEILDDLANISKSFGEEERSSRLIILNQPNKAKDIEKLLRIDILQKGNLERNNKFWLLFEKSIREGIEKLSNYEIIALREWIYAKI